MSASIEQINARLPDRYRVERQVGAGGMATIYLAHDLKHDRHVALKILNDELSATVGADRFLREVRFAARLTHPHILPLYDSGSVDELLYYVMPYVPGESLRDRLTREGRLPVAEALRLAAEVGEALAYAHREGIVHRDIKPDNILLSEGHAVVADFGIARAIDVGDQRLTGTGIAVGTPDYMSPEQAAGERVDGRGDIYSLACVLYEMLAGQPPFTAASARAVIARHMTDPVPPIRTVRGTVDARVESAVERALAKDPADRFPTAESFVNAFTGAVSPERGPWDSTRRQMPVVVLATALLVAGVATVGVLLTHRSPITSLGSRTDATTDVSRVLDRRRVALLPLSVSRASDEYLAQGILEGVTEALSQAPSLTIIARSSVVKARDDVHSVSGIGRVLRAGTVAQGSVAQRHDSIDVRVRLVDANDEADILAEDFVAPSSGVRDLQTRIASGIAQAPATRLVAAPIESASPRREAAYDAYLRGTYFTSRNVNSNRYTNLQQDSALYYFTSARRLDPRFPLSYIGLAKVYHGRFFNFDSSPKWEKLAFENIGIALRLDPNLAEAYEEKANLLWTLSNGFPHEATSKLYHRALQLKPSYADPHFTLGALYMHTGLFEAALAQFDTAQNLDPENNFAGPRIARIHYFQGKLELAEREYARYSQWTGERAIVLALLGRPMEGLALFDRAPSDTNGAARADLAAAKAVVLSALHRRTEAEAQIAIATRLGQGVSHFHHAAYAIAQSYALLGDNQRALLWLERVAAEGMPCYPLFRDDRALASLRDDPRFVRWLEDRRKQWEEFKTTL
jgi:serine/threonine-protein kinase